VYNPPKRRSPQHKDLVRRFFYALLQCVLYFVLLLGAS
jgi:hypothetical protein